MLTYVIMCKDVSVYLNIIQVGIDVAWVCVKTILYKYGTLEGIAI